MATKIGPWFPSLKKTLLFIALIAIIAAIPITVISVQMQQQTQQHAAGIECTYAFNSATSCSSYCDKQEDKQCTQNTQGKWGCCSAVLNNVTPTIDISSANPVSCSRCSDTYKYCYISWTSKLACNDTENGKYKVDCSCTQGILDCGLKEIDTSICKPKCVPEAKKCTCIANSLGCKANTGGNNLEVCKSVSCDENGDHKVTTSRLCSTSCNIEPTLKPNK
jgi:hypothetical protein